MFVVKISSFAVSLLVAGVAVAQGAYPGYVPPVQQQQVPYYADDTRGVYVPAHDQLIQRNNSQMAQAQMQMQAQNNPMDMELNRIAGDQGMLANPQMYNNQMAMMQQQPMMAGQMPQMRGQGQAVEMFAGQYRVQPLNMHNRIVRLQEDRISVRRTLRQMLDQIGGSDWHVQWDLTPQNAALPEMEISIHTEEPFVKVLDALLARVQTRSGQPLRVIRYDNSRRLIITDRPGGYAGNSSVASTLDGGQYGAPAGMSNAAVTEQMLKEAKVSLHYDEIPLVDALENIVNQGGKGQWRLRVYAGLDQVLKPAHVEEPFAIAMERLLRLFNLKFEIFPGGKLVVVTQNDRFGYNGMTE